MKSLSALYKHGAGHDRTHFLERAYRSATLTIPSVLPREDQGRDQLPQNYQSIGARGVNNLSAKLNLTLFPTQLPFFRLAVDPYVKRELAAQSPGSEAETVQEVQAQIDKNLGLIEETARIEFETGGWRPVMAEAMRHLLISGNGLILKSDNGIQFLDLRKFVVKRDPEGNLVHVVAHQMIDRQRAAKLMPEGYNLFDVQDRDEVQGAANINSVSLYTGACREDNGRFTMWQEIDGVVIGGTRSYAADRLPLIPLRFTPISGENYGASYVEEYDGDLLALEMLSRSMTEASLVAAKTLLLVRPGAAITPRTVATAANGAVKQGNPEDVSAFRLDKQADFSVAERRANTIESRLQLAFLITFQRQAERVTAEEVRQVIQQLEDGLGGVYSGLAYNVQKPVVDFILGEVLKRPNVPELPKEITPVVTTGLDAITRGQMAGKLMQAGSIAQQVLGPDTAVRAIDDRAALVQIFTSVGLNADELLKSAEQLQQEQQQAQMMALAEKAAPNAVNAMAQQPMQPPQ